MNWLDILIVVILAVSAIIGLRRGLIEMILGVAGVILGVFLAGQYYETVGSWFNFDNTNLANVLAFILILLVVLLIFYLAAKFITKLADIALLGWINRIGGALLGTLIAAIAIAAVLAILVKYQSWSVINDSLLSRFFLENFPLVLDLLPSSFQSVKDWFTK